MAPGRGSLEKQDCRVFVGTITEDVRESDIREEFSKFGEIVTIDLLKKGGNGYGYAFVQFANKDIVEDVLASKDKIRLGKEEVKLGRAHASTKDSTANRRRSPSPANRRRSPSPANRRSSFYDQPTRRDDTDHRPRKLSRSRSPVGRSALNVHEYRVTVDNLPDDMTWQELKRLAGDYGKSVTFARVNKTRDGVSGIVAFTEKRDVEKLISSLDGKKMEGCDRRLRVEEEATRVEPVIRRRPASPERNYSRRY